MVWDIHSYEDISTKHQLMNQSVGRTAPATPGLLKSRQFKRKHVSESTKTNTKIS